MCCSPGDTAQAPAELCATQTGLSLHLTEPLFQESPGKKPPQACRGAIFFPSLISKENTPPLSSSPDMCFPSCAGLSLHCRLLHKESAAEQCWDPPCSGLP